METNTCPNCHQPVEAGAEFCGNCGYKLAKPVKGGLSAKVIPPTINSNSEAIIGGPGVPINAKVNSESSAEKRSIIALIIGVVGIPASLIPIAGLILGLTGLIIGTNARVRYKHTLNLLAIIFSVIAIIASLGFWVKAIQNKSYTQKGPFSTINTVCYSVKVDSVLSGLKPRGCSFNATSKNEEFAVVGIKNTQITSSNLADSGQKSLADGAVSSGGKISGGHIGTFAGSPAYLANYTSSKKNTSGVFAFVLHPTPKGDNIFIIGRAVVGHGLNSFGTLETTWQWKK